MKNKFSPSRRNFVKSALVFGALLAKEMLIPAPVFSACPLTPREAEGPFYPLNFPIDKDNDLTFVNSQNQKAKGEIILIEGRVQDEDCQPVHGALVEIWQACATGRYNHPGDSNSAELDPSFQYWRKATTNEKGEYGFKTIKPGSYPASWLWTRPPHIHFTVQSRGHTQLTTQMYFAGEPFNKKDRLLRRHSPVEQAQCIIPFREMEGQRSGQFNLTLRKPKYLLLFVKGAGGILFCVGARHAVPRVSGFTPPGHEG